MKTVRWIPAKAEYSPADYHTLYAERRTLRDADSLLNRIAVHLDEETRASLAPVRLHIWNELNGVINALGY